MIKTVGFDGLNPPVLNPTIAYQESPLWHQGSRLISGMGLVLIAVIVLGIGKKKGFHVRNEIHYPRSIF